jgi:hypothetical protein
MGFVCRQGKVLGQQNLDAVTFPNLNAREAIDLAIEDS